MSEQNGERIVALYYFILKSHWDSYPDTEGGEFENVSAAREQAVTVARELMRNRELDTRFWRIEICDEYLQHCAEVLFSSIDPTIDHLPPELRRSIDLVSRKSAGLTEAILKVRATMGDVKDTLARANRFLNVLPRTK
jgi:hypothetical protein